MPAKTTNISDATAISAGFAHTCVLRRDSSIYCWGSNSYGQLGNGEQGDGWGDDSAYSVIPVQVNNISDATAISAGGLHTCALIKDSTIKCWGSNYDGRLGSNLNSRSSVPVRVTDITDATAVTTGGAHTCALIKDSTIKCWGENHDGQLGSSTADNRTSVPVSVTNITNAAITNVAAISAGLFHTCALIKDSTIKCWGGNYSGQLGNSTDRLGNNNPSAIVNNPSATPVKVTDITDATAIAAGDSHTCALIKDSTIKCWGINFLGQLGTGTYPHTFTPVRVTDITDATAISVDDHTCALKRDGSIYCWGNNENGQLGTGIISRSTALVRVTDITDATAISAGFDHTCALIQDSTIKCWGSNYNGQLGSGTDSRSTAPVRVTDITNATAISAGQDHTCALIKDNTIKCWGDNWYGQLGNSTEDNNTSVPVRVTDITDATAISAGRYHTCALIKNSTIKCWGRNFGDQLEINTDTGSSVPVKVPNITDATAITSWDNTCALIKDSTIKCWARLGSNSEGSSISVPVKVTDATAISKGYKHTCALKRDGSIYCWGRNNFVQLGNGEQGYGLGDDSADSVIPVQVKNISDATAITAGKYHTCALKRDGSIYCWGNNYNGQLGSNTEGINSSVPVRVTDITDAIAITTNSNRSCALHEDGTISCWGSNSDGQLGDGYIRGTPEKVKGIGG